MELIMRVLEFTFVSSLKFPLVVRNEKAYIAAVEVLHNPFAGNHFPP
jgi:hypothetical protein